MTMNVEDLRADQLVRAHLKPVDQPPGSDPAVVVGRVLVARSESVLIGRELTDAELVAANATEDGVVQTDVWDIDFDELLELELLEDVEGVEVIEPLVPEIAEIERARNSIVLPTPRPVITVFLPKAVDFTGALMLLVAEYFPDVVVRPDPNDPEIVHFVDPSTDAGEPDVEGMVREEAARQRALADTEDSDA